MPIGLVHTEETKRKISRAAIRTMKQPNAGFKQRIPCPNGCGAIMSPANMGRHTKSCDDILRLMDTYPRLFPHRPTYHQYKMFKTHLRMDYGISIDEYATMVEKQEGMCAICKDETKLFVDHDHKTNKVRELLCHHCNVMIGSAKENVDTLRSAEVYLTKWKD